MTRTKMSKKKKERRSEEEEKRTKTITKKKQEYITRLTLAFMSKNCEETKACRASFEHNRTKRRKGQSVTHNKNTQIDKAQNK